MPLSLALGPETRLAQTAQFSPRLQHAVRLLNMSSLDYAAALAEEAADNPFLEVEPPEDSPWTQTMPQRQASDTELDAAARQPKELTLREHLEGQLGVLRLSPTERACACAIVESLDEDGYLRISLEELAELAPLPAQQHPGEPDARQAEWRTALRRVQALDPPGVAARDLRECLLLQLPQAGDAACRALVQQILQQHLPILAQGDMKRLQRAVGCSATELGRAMAAVRRLRPKPGADFAAELAPGVVPEILVRRRAGRWVALLNDDAFPRVKVDRGLADWAAGRGRAVAPEARQLLERAQWTLHNLGQRAATIQAVGSAIVERQRLFFEHGPLALKPLEMREVAQSIDVHPSTVSRVVHNKFLTGPMGTFELRHFFARGASTGAAANCAPAALQALLRTLVESEPAGAPYSDVQLTRMLARHGFALARRTVTKYRQALRIEPVERRRIAALGGSSR